MPWSDWLLVALLVGSVLALIWAWRWPWPGGWAALILLAIFLLLYWLFQAEFFPWAGLVWLIHILGPALIFILVGRKSRQIGAA